MIRLASLFLVYGCGVIALQGVFPLPGDLLLLAVVYFGFEAEEWAEGLSVSLGLGFFLDAASLAPLGTALFSYSAVFGAIRFLRSKIEFSSPFSRLGWVAFLTLLAELVAWGYTGAVSDVGRPFWEGLWVIGEKMIFNSFFGLLWFKVLSWYWGLTWDQLLEPSNPLYRRRE